MWCILVAGGSGSRFGGDKQHADVGGRSVLDRSIDVAARSCDGVVVVLPAAEAEAKPETPDSGTGGHGADVVVAGGATRAASVRAGLEAIPSDAAFVLVHDAARPLATAVLFDRVILALMGGAEAVVPAIPVVDSVRHRVDGSVDRSELVVVQTPQGFVAHRLRQAHASAGEASDDATLVEEIGGTVTLIDGEVSNLKLTYPHDLHTARALLDARLPE